MAKFPSADQPRKPGIDPGLLEAVKAVLRSLPKGVQTPELSSDTVEALLEPTKIRGSDLDIVMETLAQEGSISARKSGIGHWYIHTINPNI